MESLFRELGFSESEAKVYLALADLGGSAAGLLAKRLGTPRTTVYSALESLVSRGLVSTEEQGGITRFLANPPSSLLRMMSEEKQAFEQRERRARELVEELTPLFRSKNINVPRLQFFDGKRSVETLLEEYTPAWRASIEKHDNCWWGYQDHTFVEQYRPWLDSVWASMGKEEKIFLVSNQVPIEKELRGKVKGREIRAITDELKFSSTVWVLGDFIVMIATKERPHYAFQIRDAVFAENLRSIFQALWPRVEAPTVEAGLIAKGRAKSRANKPKAT